MKYPYLIHVPKSREMTTTFAGYNHNLSCADGEFYDTENITSEYFPILSPRHKRCTSKSFTQLNGIADKETLVWIDGADLYIDNELKTLDGVTLSTEENMLPKKIYKMGAYVVIFPDKVWYNTKDEKCGKIESRFTTDGTKNVKFEIFYYNGETDNYTNSKIHPESYYTDHDPQDGDIMRVTKDKKTSLKIYYKALSMWSTLATTFIKITYDGIDSAFEEDDGIKIYLTKLSSGFPKWTKDFFVNKEDDGRRSIGTYIVDKGENYIIIPGIIPKDVTNTYKMEFVRECKDMPYITECQNRLWGCSEDGHEIYCCKQGDPTNWSFYKGVSLDSWAATVGSDGKFTGATTYNQNPIFFKEDLMLKVTVSASGAHSYREVPCPGVQDGSSASIQQINSVVYYKGPSGVYAYDGSVPQMISTSLGMPTYRKAVGGSVKYRYYLCMKDESDKPSLFVYDTQKGIWTREDDTYSEYFVSHKDDLFYVKDNKLVSVCGNALYDDAETEKDVKWMVESGYIGFNVADKKYVSRLNLRMTLEVGAYVDFWIEYDSDGRWEHIFNMSGKGTKSFVMPIRTRRCDHFRYRLSGKGECKIFSITKDIEEGTE